MKPLLLVEEALDAPLGRFFKFFPVQFIVAKLAVRRELPVYFLEVFRHCFCQLSFCQFVRFNLVGVRVEEGYQFAFAFHDDGFADIRHVVQFVLDFLRVDVLPVGAQNHILAPSLDVDIPVGVDDAHVARVQPAVRVEGGGSGFRVLEVTGHDAIPLGKDFSDNMLLVRGVDAQRDTVNRFAATARLESLPVVIAQQGTAFRHAVPHGVREADGVQEMFYFLVERGAADNQFFETPAESCHHFLPDFLPDFFIDDRDAHQQFHVRLLNGGEHFFPDNLLDDEGDGDNQVGLDFRKGVGDDFGRRRAGKEMDVHAAGKFVYEFKGKPVHVCHGKHADHLFAGREPENAEGEFQVCPQAAVGEHDPFREAGGARSIVDDGKVVPAVIFIMDVLRAEAFGEFLPEQFVEAVPRLGELFLAGEPEGVILDAQHPVHPRDGVHPDAFPYHVARKEQACFRMVDDVVDGVRLELIEDGDCHCAVGQDGEERRAPVAHVPPAEGDFVPLPDAAMFKKQVQLFDFARHVFVGIGCAFEVCQGSPVPVVFNTLFYIFQKAFFHKHMFFRNGKGTLFWRKQEAGGLFFLGAGVAPVPVPSPCAQGGTGAEAVGDVRFPPGPGSVFPPPSRGRPPSRPAASFLPVACWWLATDLP